jgi:hypothetical protein
MRTSQHIQIQIGVLVAAVALVAATALACPKLDVVGIGKAYGQEGDRCEWPDIHNAVLNAWSDAENDAYFKAGSECFNVSCPFFDAERGGIQGIGCDIVDGAPRVIVTATLAVQCSDPD